MIVEAGSLDRNSGLVWQAFVLLVTTIFDYYDTSDKHTLIDEGI